MAGRGGADTRERILDAAVELLREKGMAHATTKEMARATGISEAALYKHFSSKQELLLRVLRERLPPFIEPLERLPSLAGTRTVADHLRRVVCNAVAYYQNLVDVTGALFAEPTLLERHRAALKRSGRGPHLGIEALSNYLDRERELGRIDGDADTRAAASLMLGACYQRAFFAAYLGPHVLVDTVEQFAVATVRTVLSGVAAGEVAR